MTNFSRYLFIILLTAVLSNYCISQEKAGLKIYFSADKFEISETENAKIIHFIDSLKDVNISDINIIGFCNDIDTEQHNDVLSKNRANQVKQKLIELKIQESLISKVEGKGEIQLNNSIKLDYKEQRRENRRVEVFFLYTKAEPEPEKFVEEIKPKEEKKVVKQLFSDSVKVGDKIVLENILFYGNAHIFREYSYPALENLLAVLQQKSELTIKILGHVCCGYDDGYDDEYGTKNLSFTRAKAVYDYLISNGIDSTRLSYTGLAGRFPTGKGDTADKRVEVQITGIRK